MRYFITGGAGFIGSNMVDTLAEMECERITVYDNLTSGKKEFLQGHWGKSYFHFIEADLLDLATLSKVMAGQEMVFHFASNPDIAKSMTQTDLDLHQGIIATYNVLEAMRLEGVKKIVYASGSGVYGDLGYHETPEDLGPLLPISMYGASKLGGEGFISAFCHMFDLQAWIFRFANVVGRRQTHGVGFDFIRKLKDNPAELLIRGNGTQSKSYIHVDDVINAVLYCVAHAADRVNLFNVATEDYLEVNGIARIVMEEMGLAHTRLAYTGGARGWKGDVPIVRFNLDKIHRLGWRATHDSAAAMRKSIQEMLAG